MGRIIFTGNCVLIPAYQCLSRAGAHTPFRRRDGVTTVPPLATPSGRSLTCTSTQLNRLTQSMGKKTTTTDRARTCKEKQGDRAQTRGGEVERSTHWTLGGWPRASLHPSMCRRHLVQLSSRQSHARLRTKRQLHHSEVWGPPDGLHVRCGWGTGSETGREPVLRCEVPLGLRQPLTPTLQLCLAHRARRCSSRTVSVHHVKASGLARGEHGRDAHHRPGNGAKLMPRISRSTDDRRHRQTHFKTKSSISHEKQL